MPARPAVVGGGRMGEALLSGLLAAGWASAQDLVVVEKLADQRQRLAARHPTLTVTDKPPPSEAAVIAVKPTDVQEACGVVAASGPSRGLSLAAGVPLRRLEEWLPGGTPVVRAMPNTPALVGAGAAAVAAGSAAGEEDLAWAESILSAVGVVVRVPESLLDAVTGLSGSGPGYVFLFAETLVDAGVLVGLPRDVATVLAFQTLLGAARMLDETDQTPESLRAAVTSPGGTTAAGLRVLEARGLRAAILEAVAAATERSRQLGQG